MLETSAGAPAAPSAASDVDYNQKPFSGSIHLSIFSQLKKKKGVWFNKCHKTSSLHFYSACGVHAKPKYVSLIVKDQPNNTGNG